MSPVHSPKNYQTLFPNFFLIFFLKILPNFFLIFNTNYLSMIAAGISPKILSGFKKYMNLQFFFRKYFEKFSRNIFFEKLLEALFQAFLQTVKCLSKLAPKSLKCLEDMCKAFLFTKKSLYFFRTYLKISFASNAQGLSLQ